MFLIVISSPETSNRLELIILSTLVTFTPSSPSAALLSIKPR